MNAVDTNVLIYRIDCQEPIKQAKARVLLRQLSTVGTPTVLLWQVLGELMWQLRTWQDQGQITRDAFIRYPAAFRKMHPLVMPTQQVADHAIELTGRYSLSHWDAMLLGACKDVGVTTLYTEDMGAPASFDGIQLINPFV